MFKIPINWLNKWLKTNDLGWGYVHDRRVDKYPYQHNRRADKDSYPHNRNVTDDLWLFVA